MADACVIGPDVDTITFVKGKWELSDGRTVSDLSTCKILPSSKPRRIVVGYSEVKPRGRLKSRKKAPKSPEKVSFELDSPPPQNTESTMEPNEITEIAQIAKLAGESVWGMILLLGLYFAYKLMNKKVDVNQDLSTQCTSRHKENSESVSELQKKFADVDRRLMILELESRYKNNAENKKDT